jgi:hypothetical protein
MQALYLAQAQVPDGANLSKSRVFLRARERILGSSRWNYESKPSHRSVDARWRRGRSPVG